MHFRKVTLVGVGLLGGSLGLALRRRRLASEVAGYVRRPASIAECEKAGATDYATTDLLAAVSGAELVVLCTPLAQMLPLAGQMAPALKRGAIVTDVGSVKGGLVAALQKQVAAVGGHFIGSHPMAGAEKSGVMAARGDLFRGSVCVVTRTPNSNRAALRKVEQLWKSVGCRVLPLSPDVHDALVSRSSHLPHIAAAALANLVLHPKSPAEQGALCANGFRDTTRIASGSPEMWRDIALANRRNLATAIDLFTADLQNFRRALKKADAAAISRFFESAKQRRDAWCAQCASPSPE
ncbi:MAG: prephenate dehydrogenase/arogenate dehydrogenase family protein [Verrucomicrobiota bacterium]